MTLINLKGVLYLFYIFISLSLSLSLSVYILHTLLINLILSI